MDTKVVILSELAKNLISSSDSDSLDSKEGESLMLIMLRNEKRLISRARCKNYVEDVVSSYTNYEFQMHFR